MLAIKCLSHFLLPDSDSLKVLDKGVSCVSSQGMLGYNLSGTGELNSFRLSRYFYLLECFGIRFPHSIICFSFSGLTISNLNWKRKESRQPFTLYYLSIHISRPVPFVLVLNIN